MLPDSDDNLLLSRCEHYCIPGLNEIRFISEKQTIALVLGSCTSTVLIGRGANYILGANHIVIADPTPGSRLATKGAVQQVNELLAGFDSLFGISPDNVICLHLVGGGKKKDVTIDINEKNINSTAKALESKGILTIFKDTGNYFVSDYSIQKNNLSVFIENKFSGRHISFIIDLDQLFLLEDSIRPCFPVSSLEPTEEFDFLVDKGIITFITGKRDR